MYQFEQISIKLDPLDADYIPLKTKMLFIPAIFLSNMY